MNLMFQSVHIDVFILGSVKQRSALKDVFTPLFYVTRLAWYALEWKKEHALQSSFPDPDH